MWSTGDVNAYDHLFQSRESTTVEQKKSLVLRSPYNVREQAKQRRHCKDEVCPRRLSSSVSVEIGIYIPT
ncbi:hypothetical protein LSTR_LSTR004980 [Laodelphax striatellus]|uniref:Uncharacterized protein n=1 Tax=Laodelphax striatellus TaxID=195883 RepID=A0A482XQ23_LAOST|nr:hypothetical protein LSTR_LSTR004980 [Laodelphax striatellus]